MNRRVFFPPSLSKWLLVGFVLCSFLATSLSFAGAQESGEPIDSNAAATQELRLAGPLVLESLDPAFAKDLPTMFLIRQIYSGLMRLDNELQPVPAIAESVDVSADGLEYTFTIAENARFFDGSHIEPEDVVYSLTRALSPITADGDAGQLAAPTFLADIEGAEELLSAETDALSGIEVVDDRAVRITLSEPRSTFLMRLASAPASIVDQADMELGDRWWTSPNASGPFAVEEFVEGENILLVPNQHYVLGEPFLDRVTIRIGSAAFGGLTLYEEGIIDVSSVDLFNVERVLDPENSFSAETVVTPQLAVEYIALGSDQPPLDDENIRKALLIGFPSNRVADVSFNGRVAPASGLIPDGMMGLENWPITDRSYQLEEARRLIAESSYGSADQVPPIDIYAATPERAESLRDSVATELGLEIHVHAVEWADFLDGLSEQRYPAYLLYWGADYPDPETFLLTLFGSDSADNYIGYENPVFDTTLEAAALEIDEDSRAVIYQEANQILIDDAVVLPIYYDTAYTVVKPWVRDLVVTPLGILYLDDVWIAE